MTHKEVLLARIAALETVVLEQTHANSRGDFTLGSIGVLDRARTEIAALKQAVSFFDLKDTIETWMLGAQSLLEAFEKRTPGSRHLRGKYEGIIAAYKMILKELEKKEVVYDRG